ncbi:MAG: hypothetical protein IJG38_10725 [Thermoguttaceae bacterium]|nr:hypothetical protein [Thermoguttaceae bacterium]
MNPYQQWLGLYNFSGVKPNYYELLGLQFGESNPYVIEQAANEMATRLNSVNPGPDVALWNSIMTEIQNAQMCLCNPASRMDYDNSLRGGMGGFGGGYSAGAAFGGGNMGYAQPPMAQPPMPPVTGGFGGGYSAGSAFGGSPAPQMATPPIPSAPPVPSAPSVPPVPSVPSASAPTPVRPAAPQATPVATPVATAVTAAGAATVATAVASTAKATSPTPPPSPTGGANLNLGNSKKKKIRKKGAAGSGALYGIYTALAIAGLLLTLWLLSSFLKNATDEQYRNIADSENASSQGSANVEDNEVLQGTRNLPRTIEKKVDETEKVKPVAAPKRKGVSRRNKDNVPVRDVVDGDKVAGDDVVIGDGRLIDGEVTDDAPDIRELGVSDDKGGVIDERSDDFRIGTGRAVVVNDRDNVDSVEEAIEHATGIDIAPNEDGETAPNFSARNDNGGNVEVIDDPRLGTGYDGAVQVTRRPRTSIFDSDKPAAVENVQPAVENNVQPGAQPGAAVPNSAPEDVNYDNVAEDLVIEKSAPNVEIPAIEEEPAPADEQPQPAVEEPKTEEPKAEELKPAAEQPKAEEPKPAAEQPKAEEPKPASEQPKAEEPKPAAEQPKAEDPKPAEEQPKAEEPKPAKPAKVDIPRESELMAAEAKIEADNADSLKSGDSSSKIALAQKLIDGAASQSPADQYAALTKARNLATDAKNVEVAMKAIELKSKAFNNVDSYNEGVDVLLSCKPNAWPESQKKAVVAAAEKWLGVAKKKNESRTAKKLQEIIDANK